jgi:putative tryptophan/tyrosine transport system substrate-binding protein
VGIVTDVLLARDADEMTKALQEAVKESVAAIVILRDDLFDLNRKQLAELALRMKVPTMAGWREYAQDGCFISYGVNFTELFHREALYVAKILKGATPRELPIEQAETFELVINLKTAKALGQTVPPRVLAIADEVIE